MHRDAELKRFANCRRFHTRAHAAPERRVEQHHVDRGIQNVRRELFEVHYDGVGRERHAHFLAHAAHAVHAKHRIFEIVVAYVFDLLSKPDRRFSGPHTVRIETKPVAGQRSRECTITLELVLRRKHTAFQLVRSETITLLQRLRRGDELLDRPDLSYTLRVRITEEQVRRERHALA